MTRQGADAARMPQGGGGVEAYSMAEMAQMGRGEMAGSRGSVGGMYAGGVGEGRGPPRGGGGARGGGAPRPGGGRWLCRWRMLEMWAVDTAGAGGRAIKWLTACRTWPRTATARGTWTR